MATIPINQFIENQSIGEEEEERKMSPECKNLLLALPKEKGWHTPYYYLFQHFWCVPHLIPTITSFQKHFQAKDNDIVIATVPKSGTTWLKALAFAIVNRKCFAPSQPNHPLLTSNSHNLVPTFETKLYTNNEVPDLSNMPQPRLFGTHIPFPSFPHSIKHSNCKIIYLCRNPFDTFVSSWVFYGKLRPASLPPLTLEEAFELYCKGIVRNGPIWTHMLGYWKESKETPNKIMFLKYEDLKENTKFHVEKVAEFLDCPFSTEEETSDVIENIIELCSFEKMKELEVNKTGKLVNYVEYKHFFRKGEVGDWANYFSPSMVERLSNIIEEKLDGSGLSFKVQTTPSA